jgi:small-conductance mechanosensitive channel
MEPTIRFIERHWQTLLLPLGVTGTVILVGWAVRNVIFHSLYQRALGTKSKLDEIIVQALRGPFMIWVLMLGLHLGVQTSKLPIGAQDTASQILLVLFVISMTLVASRLAGVLIRMHASPVAFSSLTENLARIIVVLLGATIALNTLGISVWPILTAFGVGGIAIALALQDTLSNLFSGFYVSIAGQVRIGDYVKLDSGEEGYIVDTSWRSTSVRSLQNNTIIIPNAKLAKATITNYDLPEQSMSVSIAVSVSYNCDPGDVENVLLEVARKAVDQVPGLLGEPAAIVRFIPGFGPSSLDLTLTCSVRKFADQYLVQHELRKRIFTAFREAKIEIPFPTRTIYMHSDAPAPGNPTKIASERDEPGPTI